jgi:predicted  nucleic acid-binding Zn-ribbon protein
MPEASQLSYALVALRDLGRDLEQLVQAFEGRHDDVRYGLDDLAHQRVVDALDDVHGNWDNKREQLVKGLRALAEMAEKSADTFESVDEDLARKIRDALACR